MRQYSPNGFSRPGHVKDVSVKLLQRARSTIAAVSLLTLGAIIAGCGSSGGGGDTSPGVSPQVVTGVAATGSPLVGQVTLRDASSKDKSSDLASDGTFAIDVSNMTGPFVLKATGTADGVSRTLFSFADKAGIANVNPLTTVALANAAGVDDPASVFDKPDASTLAKVKSGMPGSVATIQTKLKPLLDAFSVASTNPVNAPFAADHTGLDGVFDNVKVVIANGTLTITNATTGAVVFTAQLKDIEHGSFTDNDDDVPKQGPRPPAPTGVTAAGGDGQVTVSWDPVANATAYDLFYSTKSKVAEEDDNGDVEAKHVKNVTSPFVITGLAPSTTYFVIVRAINNNRRGPKSAEVSATTTANTPTATIPAAPIAVAATGGTRQVTLSWTAVSGATSYNLYWSTTTGVTTATGTKISGIASPPAVHTNLADSTTYFYVVTAVNSAGESAASAQAQATTLAAGSTTTSTAATTSSTTAGSTTSTTARTTSTTAGTTSTTAGGGTTSTAPTTSTSTTTSTAATTTTTASTTTTTLALNGAALYATNCADCHSPLASSEKRGATVADINAGIAGVTSMRNGILTRNGGSSLTQAQIAAISAALQ
jgi:mono/diheme cytochrome c family protein